MIHSVSLKQSSTRKLAERQSDLQSKTAAKVQLAQENEVLRARIAAQPLSKADLHKMVLERNKTKEVLDAVSSQCEEMETKVHQQEVASVAEMRNLEASVSRYHQLCHRLKLMPASAKRADGTTYELRINRDASGPGDFANLDLKGAIRPALERLCDQYRTKAQQLSHDLLGLRENEACGRESIAERNEDNSALQQQTARMEAQLREAREYQDDRVREEGGRADLLKKEVSRLRSAASSLQAELEAHKRAAAEQLDSLQRACEADLARVKGELSAALEAMATHRAWVAARVDCAVGHVSGAHERVRATPSPVGV
ncbi:hypothetical protein FOA52_002698 [Chlamydomonas sp. UWO 241]|nr:hypothetical protein FOA52_002698 [Chlamydomonas sp. UWO 241]